MRRLVLMALVPVVALVGTACATGGGGGVETDYNPALASDFEQWQTYDWMTLPPTRTSGWYGQERENFIQETVDRELQARGFQRVQQNPDFRVAYHASTGRMDVRNLTEAYGYRWQDWYQQGQADTFVQEYMEGTFVLDFVRASNNSLAWRGVAQGALGFDNSRQIVFPRAQSAVQNILSQFPPSAGEPDPDPQP